MLSNKIKMIVLDVDGVLTDGTIYIGSDGTEFKKFNVKDGMGISLARFAGIQFAIITGRSSNALSIRANELKIDYLYQGISNKMKALNELMLSLNLSKEEVCYMGDDINDLIVIKNVGISFAPNDAVEFIKENVTYVTNANGGHGAVREMVEVILKGHSNYRELVNEYLNTTYNIIQ
jgi:3-deoxy-D-manno-octulosonate 8-phosphate phosphatase (KDO 8-P phosphatase)